MKIFAGYGCGRTPQFNDRVHLTRWPKRALPLLRREPRMPLPLLPHRRNRGSSPRLPGVTAHREASCIRTIGTVGAPAICGAAAGAIIAFALERHRRRKNLVRWELGQCHSLEYMLVHMMSTLEDFEEHLFGAFETTHGRRPMWQQVTSQSSGRHAGARPGFRRQGLCLPAPSRI
jgi:hypothetical protein